MAHCNQVTIIGRLHSRSKLQMTRTETPVITALVASTTLWQKEDGVVVEQTEAHRVVIAGADAIALVAARETSPLVRIDGAIRTRFWTGRDCVPRHATEVVSRRLQVLGGEPGSPGAIKQLDPSPPAPWEFEAPLPFVEIES